MRCQVVSTPYAGHLKVYVQGDVGERAGKAVFVTVHDVGANQRTFEQFVNNGAMAEVRRKSLWLHVCLPGQDDVDAPLPADYVFPTLDGLAHDLLCVLDQLELRTVVAVGEGAGASVACRFGLFYPNRCLGLVLIDCTSSTAGVDEYIKSTMFNWAEGGGRLVDKVMRYVTFHKRSSAGADWQSRGVLAPNLGRYLDAYLKRTDICKLLATQLKVETLLVNGSRAPNVGSAYAINRLNSKSTTVVIVDGVGDALVEAPWNLARAFILFAKGCGVLLGVAMLGLEREFALLQAKQAAGEQQHQVARALLDKERLLTL